MRSLHVVLPVALMLVGVGFLGLASLRVLPANGAASDCFPHTLILPMLAAGEAGSGAAPSTTPPSPPCIVIPSTTQTPTPTPTATETATHTATSTPTGSVTATPTNTPTPSPTPTYAPGQHPVTYAECTSEGDCGPPPILVICPPDGTWFIDRDRDFPNPGWPTAEGTSIRNAAELGEAHCVVE